MSEEFDPADYSFVVKRRGNPLKPWRWEIYCAGKSGPVERSPVFFESMAEAADAIASSRRSRLPCVYYFFLAVVVRYETTAAAR